MQWRNTRRTLVLIELKITFKVERHLNLWNEINQLNHSKKTNGELSTDIVKSLANNFVGYFAFFVNKMFANNTFPSKLKLADVSPIFVGHQRL